MRRFAARTQVRRSLAVTVSRAIAPTFNLHQQRQFGRHFQFWIFAGIALQFLRKRTSRGPPPSLPAQSGTSLHLCRRGVRRIGI
jgi:hypothetical protein